MDTVCFTSSAGDLMQGLGGVEGLLAVFFMISIAVAVLISPMYLMIYQAFVRMLMMVKNPDADKSAAGQTKSASPVNALFAPVSDGKLLLAMKSGYRRFNLTLILSVGLYASGLIVLMTSYRLSDAGFADLSIAGWVEEILVSVIVVALMVLPVLNQLFLPGWYRRTIGIVLIVFACVIGISLALDEGFDDIPALAENFSLFLLVGLVVVGFAVQSIRNVAAQVLLAVMVFLVSSFLYFFLLALSEDCVLPPLFGVIGPEVLGILTLFAVIVYFPFLYLVRQVLWYSVGRMVRAYDKGYYSDFQLQTMLWLLLITLFTGLAIVAETQDDNIIDRRAAYAFGVLALSTVCYLMLNRRTQVWKPAKSLLYLRVFATEKYSEYLFDHVSKYWRHVGPVNMIGGPDFALLNLDIKEAYYLIFKRSLIHELFIDDFAALQERLATMNRLPSSDKQYMVNEFFCTDNMWQETVTELATQADHVLLDLRGFSGERKGAEFELQLLGKMGLLEHTTIVVDSRTDWRAIRAALEGLPEVDIPEQCVLEMKGAKIDARVIEYLAR